jgi:hypothetical protein
MSQLLRAPRPVGSWFWDDEDLERPADLTQTLETAQQMADILREFGLLRTSGLEYRWDVYGTGPIGITTRLTLNQKRLNDAAVPDLILGSRPVSHPKAWPFHLYVTGRGTWIDAMGEEHEEFGLVDLSVPAEPDGQFAQLDVHHDIWSLYSFDGKPHPEIYRRNAPRLAAALKKLNDSLGLPATEDIGTTFGEAEGFGIRLENPGPDGLAADVTRWL